MAGWIKGPFGFPERGKGTADGANLDKRAAFEAAVAEIMDRGKSTLANALNEETLLRATEQVRTLGTAAHRSIINAAETASHLLHPDELAENEIDGAKLRINREKIFEVAVVANMSSGKSTFINALIGNEFLPTQNQACTSRTVAILDNDNADSVTAHLLYPDRTYKKVDACDAKTISSMLSSKSDELADIVVECRINDIRNVVRSLFIVDTPGVNNSADRSHEEITHQYLETMRDGLVIYVMNAAVGVTDDDKRMIEFLRTVTNRNEGLQVIFLLNKADQIDTEKEPIDKAVASRTAYLKENGFSSSSLFPVSAEAALLFKMALNGTTLSRAETMKLLQYYMTFEPQDFRLSSYVYSPSRPDLSSVCVVGKQSYTRRELYAALENTGIPAVEREIERQIIDQLHSKAPKVRKPIPDRKRG